jgi:hypothetical protein
VVKNLFAKRAGDKKQPDKGEKLPDEEWEDDVEEGVK